MASTDEDQEAVGPDDSYGDAADGASERREAWKVWGGAIAVALLGFAITFYFVKPGPDPYVRFASGAPGGAYDAFAQEYREALAKNEIELDVSSTAGSVENLAMLRAGSADVALVQGGVIGADTAGVMGLGSVYHEPLWLFCRQGVEIEFLSDLAGRVIEVGPEGSGTQSVARQLLAANGVTEDGATFHDHPSDDAVAALLSGSADAVFLVSSAETDRIRALMRQEGAAVRLFDFSRSAAYERNFRFLRTVTVPRGLFDLAADIPDRDIHLVAPMATIVARDDMHPALVPLILAAARTVHGSGGMFEDEHAFPSREAVDAPLSVAADRWYQNGVSFLYRVLPFPMAALLDRLKIMLLPLLTLLLPLIRVAPPLYRWRIRSKIFRWYRVLRRIELAIDREGKTGVSRRHAAKLAQIEAEILHVKVPPSYMEELYNLRMHLRLVRRSIAKAGGSSGRRLDGPTD